MKNGVSEVVADSQGERHIPSTVGFYPDVDPLVGLEAERRFARFWQSTTFDLKYLLGRPQADTQTMKSKWGFKVTPGRKGLSMIEFEIEEKLSKYSPQQIVPNILKKLKETAEEALHTNIEQACICIPVGMAADAYDALQEAVRSSGFEKVSYILDPVAAVIAYEQDFNDEEVLEKNLIVVDFGATVNVSLVKIQSGLIRVIKSETTPQLTAYAIEKELMNHFGAEFKRKTGFDYTESRRAVYKLKSECERIKKDLSQMQQSNIQIDGFFEGSDLNSTITRARFEAITDPILKHIVTPIQTIVNLAGGIENIKGVILTGGNVKIPKIQQYIKQFFGTSVQLFSSIDPSDVNAKGAAIQASLIVSRKAILKPKRLVPSCPLSIGIESSTGQFIPIIPKDTIVPVKILKQFKLAPGQKKILLSVYQGEDPTAENNHLLGKFVFNCSTSPETFQIAFIIDHHGVLKLYSQTERYKLDGVKNRLSPEEVQKLREVSTST